jgi:ribonuclease HI
MTIVEEMQGIAASLGLQRYDVLLVGDGSGTTLQKVGDGCGWHVEGYAPRSKKTWEWSGGVTTGTTNYAELMPYLHALWHLEAILDAARCERSMRVEIVTDSQLTARCGSREYSRNANASLWAMMDHFEKKHRIHWNWVPRNSNPISRRADRVAGKVREVLRGCG